MPIEKTDVHRLCSAADCERPALPLSDPALCPDHIADLDGWYEQFLDQLNKSDLDTSVLMATAKVLYRESQLHQPFCGELYQTYKHKVEPRRDISFAFSDIVYFVIVAAASGIVGNFAYDAIKRLVKRIGREESDDSIEETFDKIVTCSHYEQLRKIQHSDSTSESTITSETEVQIRRKYRLVVKEGR